MLGALRPKLRSDRVVAAGCAVSAAAIYLVSSWGHAQPWTFFAPLARAFLQGRWWLTETSPYLHELLPCGDGRYCVVYVPLPAIAVLPFTLFLPDAEAQRVASSVYGGLAAAPLYLVLRRLGAPLHVALLTTAFGSLGTTLWFTASDGRAWYFAHSVAVLLGSLAVLVAASRGAPWLVGSLIGAAALARLPVGLAAFGLALLTSQRRGESLPRTVALGALGMLPLVALELVYDQLRWGAPWEAGYARLAATEPYYPQGLFSLSYLPRHLYVMFMQGPHYAGDGLLFARPSWVGMSLLLVSPAFLYAIPALRRLASRRELLPLALAAALPMVPNFLHGNIGWTQWGYRFSLDAQPFLLPLVAYGAALRRENEWGRVALGFVVLVAWSVVANLYGVLSLIHLDNVVMEFPPR